jgi:LysM repeat protein
LLNAVSGVVRDCFARDRSTRLDRPATEPIPPATARPAHRRAIGAARVCADILTATPKARGRAAVATRETAERISARVARATPRGSFRRRLFRRHLVLRFRAERALPIAIALIVVAAASFSLAPAAPVGAAEGTATGQADVETARLAIGGKVDAFSDLEDQGSFDEPAFELGAVDDGTLYKPVAVDTTIQTSAGLLRHYTVKEGDTLTSIASRYGVSMMTVWWANKLSSKEQLKPGKDLVIPPVSGLVVTVAAGDTLESIAKANKITVAQIIATNVSGSWAWPVPGGYVSQYFHYGHYGVDIADSYGSPIVAPRDGTVIFAGWKSNGGGYQVWINHGNGIYSAQHHMSSVAVAAGQVVAKGQRIGRIGQSGWATGPHDHFEVWVGRPWENGSYRVNALRYY